jgi:7,8-dihydropterin-6-yl-methyl-4-(beta-D-ribofuranosyl)aminobenzene 5'-phosphate synthase
MNGHGLSLFIEASGRKILFDAGPSDATSLNARTLGIRLSDIDIAVLSHGHYDHSGGLDAFFRENPLARLYMREGADRGHYAKRKHGLEHIGVDKRLFERNGERIVKVSDNTEISSGVHILVSILRKEPLPIGNNLLFTEEGDDYVNDVFDHELVFVVEEEDGIVVFSGCGHSGILNMVRAAKQQFKKQRIKAVIGGFHLMYGSSNEDFAQNSRDASVIADGLVELGCEMIITGHCTGDHATAVFKEKLGNKHVALFTGYETDL